MPKSPGGEAWNWLMNQLELLDRTPSVPTICRGQRIHMASQS
jgi:hypothetical protein